MRERQIAPRAGHNRAIFAVPLRFAGPHGPVQKLAMASHLRVLRRADDEAAAALSRSAFCTIRVDFFDERTRRVDDFEAPLRPVPSCIRFGTPCARMMTVSPGSASSGDAISRTPSRAKRSTTWRLWMIGPSVDGALPARGWPASTRATARSTPKQKPAVFARYDLHGPSPPSL